MPKTGDVVLYSAFGRTVNALVIKVGPTQPSHAGKNGEDTLTLCFVDLGREVDHGVPKVGPLKERPGYLPQITTEHDVVHFSHEFPLEYRKQKGLSTAAQIAAERGHGTWKLGHEDLPSAADLDAVAAEEITADLTNSAPQEPTDVPTSE